MPESGAICCGVMLDRANDVYGTGVPYARRRNGAKNGTMADNLYPVTPEGPRLRVSFTVRLTPEQHRLIGLIADVWNATDAALNLKRRRRWKHSSVIARLVAVGIDNFFDGVKREPPPKGNEADFVEHCVRTLMAQAKKK